MKSDKTCIVRDLWEAALMPINISASLAASGIFPADKERDFNRLSGRGTKRNKQSFRRAPLGNLSLLVNDHYIEDNLGRRAEFNIYE